MNIKVVYFTKTGHSKKIAAAIGEALSVEPMSIDDNPSIFGVDLLFIVSGIYNGVSAPEVIQFGEKLKPSMAQRVAIVTSSSFGKDTQQKLSLTMKGNYIEVLGECIVRGSFAVISMGHPNKKDFNTAIDFAIRTIELVEGPSESEPNENEDGSQ